MIVNKELFDQAGQKYKIICLCDYCGNTFERLKHNIQRSWENVKKDSCSNYSCVHKKRTEVNRILFGVDNPFQNTEIKSKIHNKKNNHTDNNTKNKIIKCKTIKSNKYYTKTKLEIQNWINGFGFEFKENKDLNVTLYNSFQNLAIEYCGLNEHHEYCGLNARYHYDKNKNCINQNIQLLTIYSDEWICRNKQCKGHIKSILGINNQRLFARKCQIKEIDKDIGREFFQENHIQGHNNLGFIFFGLYHEDELVGAISLGRHNRQFSNLVLDRLCFKDGIQIIGGASRLFSQCVSWAKNNGHTEIMSFSDNRWSVGKVYARLNFQLDQNLYPDYSYVDTTKLDTRLSKQSQKKSVVNCPEGLTEYEWAHSRGLARIWDCGKKRWIYKF